MSTIIKKKKKIVKNVDFLALLDIKSILSKRERERERDLIRY